MESFGSYGLPSLLSVGHENRDKYLGGIQFYPQYVSLPIDIIPQLTLGMVQRRLELMSKMGSTLAFACGCHHVSLVLPKTFHARRIIGLP